MAEINPSQFAVSVLKAVGAPINHNNVAALVGWANAEGGNWNNSARYNPLNTTQGAPGATAINSVGVKSYNNWQQGINATVQTLRNGNYGGILGALHTSNPQAVAQAIGASPWGTSGATVAQTIKAALGGKYNVGSGVGLGTSPAVAAGAGGIPAAYKSVTKNVPDQAAFDAAQMRYVAGSYLAHATDPYSRGAPKTGLEGSMASNPLFASGALTTKAPNPSDYQTAHTTLQKLAGSTPLNQHPVAFAGNLKGSGYTNPLPGAAWGRTDMGVDANMKAGAPIKALGDSKVVNIYPNWYKGQPYVLMQLLNGPQAGKYYYVAEAINPTVRAGQQVRAGQTIGTYNPGGTGLELGWGTAGAPTQAQATTGYTEGEQTTAGKNFRNFLHNLGAA
jgi:hypothetical protein